MRKTLLTAVLTATLGSVLPAAAREYKAIPGESTLSYRLKHPMHKVHGVTRDFACTVELAEDTASSKVQVSAQVKTFDSGNSNRDDHALEAVKARKHPVVSFASDSVRKDGAAWRIHGTLTFAGKTRPVHFAVTEKKEPGKVRIAGGFSVKLTDFGVKPPSLMFISAEDKLDIAFDLVAKDE
jgi:polyisoprenoid-binding protein YceI